MAARRVRLPRIPPAARGQQQRPRSHGAMLAASAPMLVRPRGVLPAGAEAAPDGSRQLAGLQGFAPPVAPALTQDDALRLAEFVADGDGRTLVITGAGISTESGIPDYRSPRGSYSRGHKPMQHTEFVRSASARRRYWARAQAAWRQFDRAQPNDCHRGLAQLEAAGWIQGVVTQNVDSLHSSAGSTKVVHLHGSSGGVQCLSCGAEYCRREYHGRLAEHNADWMRSIGDAFNNAQQTSDADADLSDDLVHGFSVLPCDSCGDGVLKPTVVFFGGTIPAETKARAAAEAAAASRILAVGSSLQTYSAFSLCRDAKREGKPLGLVCIGATRCDPLADLKLEASCGEAVRAVVAELCGRAPP
eukprot:TRINITY_DN627_c1_g1_i1.p1 TRINITY_DN627_c1_g1~~TRINITY_DN627_c1_g1_i1.p1  ORF type:complete len:360 (+),score=118.72 TRINITY_DN627_c1_g1_i1:90-1169(+)